MKNWRGCCAAFLVAIVLVAAVPARAEAASRGVYYRPAVTFVVNNAPEDMILYMEIEQQGETVPVFLFREDRLWESYFRLYRQTARDVRWRGNMADFRNAVLVVLTGGQETRIPLPEDTLIHLTINDFFMLDLSDHSLQYGLPLWRAVALFFLRVTLAVAGALLVLYLFRYRWRRSWLTALVVNLVCHVLWHLLLVNQINFSSSLLYILFVVILVTLVLQLIVLVWALNEQDRETSVRYAVWSNVVTGALNIAMLICFPL